VVVDRRDTVSIQKQFAGTHVAVITRQVNEKIARAAAIKNILCRTLLFFLYKFFKNIKLIFSWKSSQKKLN
jgi:hypothetical protein